MAHSIAPAPSAVDRVLGLVGILGGVVLLAAFLVEIAPDLNIVRLVLFNLGAMAIAAAVSRRLASAAPSLGLLGAAPAFLANAWYLAMVLLSVGRPQPFAGDFGLVFFLAAIAMWLADAVLGLVALRLGTISRWGALALGGALALAVGSVLAVTGIDRLALTSPSNPTIFGPLALAGVALNGIGWILLGIDVATRDRATETQPLEA